MSSPIGNGKCDTVDMRSDTVTEPTAEMRKAMSEAKVGDDVMACDPTVRELEELGSKMLGKEAAVFVPSGTMANLIAMLNHGEGWGSEIIVGNESHINRWEQGGIATLGGIHPRALAQQPDGSMLLEEIEAAVQPVNDHFPTTRAVVLEQTHNQCGGRVLPLNYIDDVAAICKRHGLKFHIDGARLFNACAVLGVGPERMVRDADSVSICLSKGLASPVGSLLLGSHEFIRKCRRMRKALGGGMRQAGVLAACGLLSLQRMALPERLGEDHRRAKELAAGIAKVPFVKVVPPDTNLVFVDWADSKVNADEVVKRMKQRGTLVLSPKQMRIRFALHYQVDDAAVAKAIADWCAVMEEITATSAETPPAKRQKS